MPFPGTCSCIGCLADSAFAMQLCPAFGCGYDVPVRPRLRFLWNATKGHRLAPWRSPYLLWRIETYTGVKMKEIGFLEFWEFMWRERRELWRFLRWTGEMERWVQPKPKA